MRGQAKWCGEWECSSFILNEQCHQRVKAGSWEWGGPNFLLYKAHHIMVLIYFSLISVEHLFMSFGHLYVFFPGKMFIHILYPFLMRFFLMLSCISCLNILDVNPLSEVSFANIFSHLLSCLFILFVLSFPVQMLFSLMQEHLFIFAFFPLAWGDRSKKILLRPMLISILPMFSSRNSLVSGLTFKSFSFFFFLSFIYLFLTALGLHCCPWVFSGCGRWELLSSSSVQASFVAEHEF